MPNSLTFAVPVEWSDARAYEENTIVFVGKRAFTALQSVPTGTAITNTTYWAETGVPFLDVSDIRSKLNELEGEVDANTAAISTANTNITTNANAITSLNTRLSAAVTSIEADAARLNNIMVSLYTPYPASSSSNSGNSNNGGN